MPGVSGQEPSEWKGVEFDRGTWESYTNRLLCLSLPRVLSWALPSLKGENKHVEPCKTKGLRDRMLAQGDCDFLRSVIGCVGITQLSLDSEFPSVKAQHLDPYIGILLAKDKRKGSSMHKGPHSKLIFMVPKTTVFPEMSVCN